MYELLDTKSAIKETQKFLYTISTELNPDVPRVAVDGIYGSETIDAVRRFQLIYGIPDTGYVDRATFDTLYLLYKDAITDKNSKDYLISSDGFPIKLGSYGSDVIAIHLYIGELSKKYSDIGDVGKGAYFTEETRRAVINLEKIFNMTPSGEIDSRLYQRILAEVDSLRRAEEEYTKYR